MVVEQIFEASPGYFNDKIKGRYLSDRVVDAKQPALLPVLIRLGNAPTVRALRAMVDHCDLHLDVLVTMAEEWNFEVRHAACASACDQRWAWLVVISAERGLVVISAGRG